MPVSAVRQWPRLRVLTFLVVFSATVYQAGYRSAAPYSLSIECSRFAFATSASSPSLPHPPPTPPTPPGEHKSVLYVCESVSARLVEQARVTVWLCELERTPHHRTGNLQLVDSEVNRSRPARSASGRDKGRGSGGGGCAAPAARLHGADRRDPCHGGDQESGKRGEPLSQGEGGLEGGGVLGGREVSREEEISCGCGGGCVSDTKS